MKKRIISALTCLVLLLSQITVSFDQVYAEEWVSDNGYCNAVTLYGASLEYEKERAAEKSLAMTIDEEDAGSSYIDGEVLVVFQEEKTIEQATEVLRTTESVVEEELTEENLISDDTVIVQIGEEVSVAEAVGELSANPSVLYAQPNYRYELFEDDPEQHTSLFSLTNDPYVTRKQLWALPAMNAFDAWTLNQTNRRVSIAIIDTGVNTVHSDLQGTIVAGTYYDAKPGGTDTGDNQGHGTHVAGIAAAQANNEIGVAGSSYDAGIIPICVGEYAWNEAEQKMEYMISSTTLCSAYTYLFSDADNDGRTLAEETNLRVINMSLGGYTSDPALEIKVNAAYAAGVLTVCAAGNEKTDSPSYPAAYEKSVSVSAIKNTGSYDSPSYIFDSSYSNFGSTIDVSAPGTGINSTVRSGGYGSMQGTSMASPQVAGVAALVFSAHPSYDLATDESPSTTVDEVRHAIEGSSTDLGDTGWDEYYGWGMVNAFEAVLAVDETVLMYDEAQVTNGSIPFSVSTTLNQIDEWTWSIVSGDGNIDESGTLTPLSPGSITVRATAKEDSRIYVESSINIEHSITIELSNDEFDFNGIEQKPIVSVLDFENELQADSDYIVSFEEDSTSAGTKVVSVASLHSFWEGEKTARYEIAPLSIEDASVSVIIPNQIYTGDPVEPKDLEIKFTNGAGTQVVLSEEIDFEVSYSNNIQVTENDARAMIQGMGNFIGETTKGFKIAGATIEYRTHVQNYGWIGSSPQASIAENGESSGTSGERLRVEALQVNLINSTGYSGGINYQTQIQDIGWDKAARVYSDGRSGNVNEGEISGTSGQSLRLETLKIWLDEGSELEVRYDIYYRVHVQDIGWMGWARNGEDAAGSVRLSLRMEAMQIYLCPKSSDPPANTFNGVSIVAEGTPCAIDASENGAVGDINYDALVHIQNKGDTPYYSIDGSIQIGTSGLSLRLEALTLLSIQDLDAISDLHYGVHVQNLGWQMPDKVEGQLAGTEGKSLRLEAFYISLSGDFSQEYDVYYRSHVQGFGWTGWAKNGQYCGSAGYSYRMEAMQIVFIKKNTTAPGLNLNYFYQA